MIEFILAASRMLIVVSSLLIAFVFFIALYRVWHDSKNVKSVFQYVWEHADKLASVGVLIGFLLLVYKQPFTPAGYQLSIFINSMFILKNAFELRGLVVGYMRNFWTARGTKREPEASVVLQTQF